MRFGMSASAPKLRVGTSAAEIRFAQLSSQKESPFASEFQSRSHANMTWHLKQSCDFPGGGCKNLTLHLAAQCEITSHIAQYPFEIVSQTGVSHPLALFS